MTVSIQHIPGRHDRTGPIETSARWVRLVLEGMARDIAPALFNRRRNGAQHVIIQLDRRDCFVASLQLPNAAWRAHASAIALRAYEIAPIDPVGAVFAAYAYNCADGITHYEIAITAADRLTALESEARAAGARQVAFCPAGRSGLVFKSRETRSRDDRLTAIVGATCLAAFLTVTVGGWALTSWLNTEHIAQLASQRHTGLERARMERDRALAQQRLDDVNMHLISARPAELAHDLSNLSSALPEGVVLTRLVWRPRGAVLWLDGPAEQIDAIEWPPSWEIASEPAEAGGAIELTRRER